MGAANDNNCPDPWLIAYDAWVNEEETKTEEEEDNADTDDSSHHG